MIWQVYASTWGSGQPFSWCYADVSEEEISQFCFWLMEMRHDEKAWAVPIYEPTAYELSQVRPLRWH